MCWQNCTVYWIVLPYNISTGPIWLHVPCTEKCSCIYYEPHITILPLWTIFFWVCSSFLLPIGHWLNWVLRRFTCLSANQKNINLASLSLSLVFLVFCFFSGLTFPWKFLALAFMSLIAFSCYRCLYVHTWKKLRMLVISVYLFMRPSYWVFTQ